MKLANTTSFLALACLATPSLAVDLGGGFSLTGNLEYEHFSTHSSDQSFGLLNADLTYESASGFGGFVGAQAISAGSSAEGFYGALSYSGSFGKIQIGAPRNALDDYVDSPSIAGLDFLDLQLGIFSGSVLPTQVLFSNKTAVGARYDGSFGATSFGISYHDLDGAKVLSAGLNFSIGDTLVKAGTEQVRVSGTSRSSYFLGVEHGFGQVTAGAILGTSDLISSDIRSIKLYATYSANDRLDVTATALNVDGPGMNGTLYGIAANYDVTDDVFVEAGYMASSGGPGIGTDIFGLSIGVNF